MRSSFEKQDLGKYLEEQRKYREKQRQAKEGARSSAPRDAQPIICNGCSTILRWQMHATYHPDDYCASCKAKNERQGEIARVFREARRQSQYYSYTAGTTGWFVIDDPAPPKEPAPTHNEFGEIVP